MKPVHATAIASGRQIMLAMAAAMLFCASRGPTAAASAQTLGSTYTSTALKGCRVTSAAMASMTATRVCPGNAGLVVPASEDDLRETVSVGRNRAAAAKEPAAQLWFGPFNSTTIEWRDGKPFAIIQRWHLADNGDQDKDGRPVAEPMPAVTRLPPGPVCHVASIDVKAIPTPTSSPARPRMRPRAISNAARTT